MLLIFGRFIDDLLTLILKGLSLCLLIRVEAELVGIGIDSGLRLLNGRQFLSTLIKEGIDNLGRVFGGWSILHLMMILVMLMHLIEVIKAW